MEGLKEMGISDFNLNYLEQFSEIELDNKVSPLLTACYLGRIDMVRLLLNNTNIDVDFASDEQNQTPLCVAAQTGNYEILKILLDYDAEVNKPNSFNQTPIICGYSRLEEEKNVFENRKICFKMAELLLQYGADIDWIVDKIRGYTLLMQLCSVKMQLSQKEKETNYQIIKFLIENGAKKNILSSKGKSLEQIAQKHKNFEKVLDLIQNSKQIYFYNQKPIVQNKYIQTPIQHLQTDVYKQKKWIEYLPFCNK